MREPWTMMDSLSQGQESALRTSSAVKESRWPTQKSYSLNQTLLMEGILYVWA